MMNERNNILGIPNIQMLNIFTIETNVQNHTKILINLSNWPIVITSLNVVNVYQSNQSIFIYNLNKNKIQVFCYFLFCDCCFVHDFF